MNAEQAALLRRLYPVVLARVLRFTRSVSDAEDAVQEAMLKAITRWTEETWPDAPDAWLTRVASNVHRDKMRKGKWETAGGAAIETLAEMSPWTQAGRPGQSSEGWNDELLRLLFASCHPALEIGECAALALATVVGMSNTEVAAAFVVKPRTMEQRLTRARQRLRERGDYDGTAPEKSLDRLPAVLRVLHLLFNEGYWSSHSDNAIREELCRLAIELGTGVVRLFPNQGEATGLLSLMMLHHARRTARRDEHGTPLSLQNQDRRRWDQQSIQHAELLLEKSMRNGPIGPYQIEAAISAVHCRAAHADATDWKEISALYNALEHLRPTPAVRVNRALATGKAEGPEAGLALLDSGCESYPYVHLVRGSLLAETGRIDEALVSLKKAFEVARNPTEREQIRTKMEALRVGEESQS